VNHAASLLVAFVAVLAFVMAGTVATWVTTLLGGVA